jgi:5-methylthioribose kinase
MTDLFSSPSTIAYSNFKALESATAIEYALQQPNLREVFEGASLADLVAEEIGDGNLNLVFRVFDRQQPQRSVIIKQALPYVRLVGESWPLTLDRARIEAAALAEYQDIVPALVPKLYHYDPDLCLTAMENLRNHVTMRKGLIAGQMYPLSGRHLGEFIAETAFRTSDFFLSPEEKKARVIKFTNPQLCRITEDLIFDEPYRPNVPNNHWNSLIDKAVQALQSDANREVKEGVFWLRWSFMTHAEAMIHGDLHTGSVMVTPEDTRVIDPEFAYYGPIGFDLGAVIGNLLLNYCAQEYHIRAVEPRKEFQAYLINTAHQTWETFLERWEVLWSEFVRPEWRFGGEAFKLHLAQETLGFAGCKMVRRVVGLAHVADLESIEDPAERALAETRALEMGQWLIRNYRKLNHYDGLMNTLAEVIKL